MTDRAGITVAIPHIPVRATYLHRALRSAQDQALPAAAVAIATDHDHRGAALTRQRALDMVTTEWVAFLDDDDELYPRHLAALRDHAAETGADYVYSWFDVAGGADPFPPGHYLNPFNPADPVQTTITVLVRTALAREVGFLRPSEGDEVGGQVWGEDYQFTLGCLRAGGRVSHLVERTWVWHHDTQNTSGRGDRW